MATTLPTFATYTGRGEFFSGVTPGARVRVLEVLPWDASRAEVTLADVRAPSITVNVSDLQF